MRPLTTVTHISLPLLLTESLTSADALPEELKDVERKRHGVSRARSPRITFIDHHSCPPTCFPKRKLQDTPSILGVRDGETYPIRHHDGPEYELVAFEKGLHQSVDHE